MNPFFSKASVRRLQPVIDERIDKLISRIKGFRNSKKPLTISIAYVAFSSGRAYSSLSCHSGFTILTRKLRRSRGILLWQLLSSSRKGGLRRRIRAMLARGCRSIPL
jgi:hypothetical protein